MGFLNMLPRSVAFVALHFVKIPTDSVHVTTAAAACVSLDPTVQLTVERWSPFPAHSKQIRSSLSSSAAGVGGAAGVALRLLLRALVRRYE